MLEVKPGLIKLRAKTTTKKAPLLVVIFALTTFTVTYMGKHEFLPPAPYFLGLVSATSAFIVYGSWAWFSYLWISPPHKGTAFLEQLLERSFGRVGHLLFDLIFSIVLFCIVGAISIRLGLIL